MLKEKEMMDLINVKFSHFRLAPITRLKNIKNVESFKDDNSIFEKLPLIEGINVEKKAETYDSYFVVGTIRPDGEDFTYEDCAFRTFDVIDAKLFNEFKEIVGYARDLLDFCIQIRRIHDID